MRRSIAATMPAFLSACAGTTSIAPPPTLLPLVGTWVLEEDDCAGDNGVIYAADGTWVAYGAEGRWVLQDSRLTSMVTAKDENDEAMVRVAKPEEHSEIVQFGDDDHYTSQWEDGTVHRLKRCRPR